MTSQPSQLSQNLSPDDQAPPMNYPGQEVQKSDDNVIVQENTENIDSIDNFDDMGLKETLLRGIYAFGYEKPSVIQQKAIPAVTKKTDIIAQNIQYLSTKSDESSTGYSSGKASGFSAPTPSSTDSNEEIPF